MSYHPWQLSDSQSNPCHAQAPPLSSYSTLSNALDMRPRGNLHSPYKNSPAHSSFYPYPRAALGIRSPNTSSSGIYAQPEPIGHRAQSSYHGASAIPPSNHLHLPQPTYVDASLAYVSYLDPVFRLAPITFQLVNMPEMGVKVKDIVGRRCTPAIFCGGDKVLALGDREIKIRILWPGYSAEHFEKRIKTQNGDINRDVLLLQLAKAVLEFIDRVKRENIPVERGYESWSVGMLPNGKKPVSVKEVVIAGLIHRGGSNWQPEIWVPMREM